jgi:SSS family solute:Na+ symporter
MPFAAIYTVICGLKAVVWTDVLQAAVLGTAIAKVMFLAVGRIEGGWSSFWAIAKAQACCGYCCGQ